MLKQFLVLSFACMLLVSGGCSLLSRSEKYNDTPDQNVAENNIAGEDAQADNAVSDIPESDIVAKVGDYIITKEDLQNSIESLKAQLGPSADTQNITQEDKKNILNMLVQNHLLYLAAKNEGVDSDPEVKKEILKAEESVLSQALLSRYKDSIDPSDAVLMDFYENGTYNGNKVKLYFTEPEKRRIQEIAVDSESEAKQILIDIMQGNTTFRSAARKFSVLKSAENGGDLGYKDVAELQQEENKSNKYITTAFMLDKGDISSVFKDNGKYYILKVVGIHPSKQSTFSEVKDKVKALYIMKKLQERQNEAIDSVKNSGIEIKIYEENL